VTPDPKLLQERWTFNIHPLKASNEIEDRIELLESTEVSLEGGREEEDLCVRGREGLGRREQILFNFCSPVAESEGPSRGEGGFY
jgi:hypothetical protein